MSTTMNNIFSDFAKKQKRRFDRQTYRIQNTFNSKLLMDQIFDSRNEYDQYNIHFYRKHGYNKGQRILSLNFINPTFSVDYSFSYGVFGFTIMDDVITSLNRKSVNICIDDLYDKGSIFSLSMIYPNINLLYRYRDLITNLVLLKNEVQSKINNSINVNSEYKRYVNLDIKDLRCTLSI